MTDPAPLPPMDDSASRLPRHTTPTWEVELLISGVTVFAMLQLPGWLDDRLFALLPRFGSEWSSPLEMMYMYAKSAAVILALTFMLHLLLRAHWIAQVGMHSVFPGGIRWDRLRIGPVQREVDEKRFGDPGATIERADNRATIVFAIGVQLATSLLAISLLLGIVYAVAVAALLLLDLDFEMFDVFGLCALMTVVPFMLAPLVDRGCGARLKAGGRLRRALAAVFRGYAHVGMSRSSGAMAVLSSHGGERRTNVISTAIIMVAITGVILTLSTLKDPEGFGAYSLMPVSQDLPARAVDAMHYDGLRDPSRDPAVPYVQAMTITSPYLRLIVPYQPGDDDAALRRNCPKALSLRDEARAVATLDCLQRVHAVMLDGKPLASLRYELGSDARTDRPALLAMVDVRALAPGRHELRVARAADHDDDEREDKPKADWTIPFWR